MTQPTFYRGPVDATELQVAVAAAFAVSAADLPPWPNPRPDGSAALAEEYSRCPDPGRYRIVGARARAWVAALVDAGLGVVEAAPTGDVWRDPPRWRVPVPSVVRVRPTRAGAIPLVLAYWPPTDRSAAGVVVGVGEPAVALERVPDCGCDACDSGSDDLLAVLDRDVSGVVSGAFVHVQADGVTAMSTGDGWSARGVDMSGVDVDALLAAARSGESPHPVLRGERWW